MTMPQDIAEVGTAVARCASEHSSAAPYLERALDAHSRIARALYAYEVVAGAAEALLRRITDDHGANFQRYAVAVADMDKLSHAINILRTSHEVRPWP